MSNVLLQTYFEADLQSVCMKVEISKPVFRICASYLVDSRSQHLGQGVAGLAETPKTYLCKPSFE